MSTPVDVTEAKAALAAYDATPLVLPDKPQAAYVCVAALRVLVKQVEAHTAGVEVTDAMVEGMARMMFARSTEGRSGFTWPVNGDWGRARDLEDARRALTYVLTFRSKCRGCHASVTSVNPNPTHDPLCSIAHPQPRPDWDRVHDRPADIYTPPEDRVFRPEVTAVPPVLVDQEEQK